MKQLNQTLSFAEKLKIEAEDKRLFHDTPKMLISIISHILDSSERVYVNDDSTKSERVFRQSFTKLYHDFKSIHFLILNGYQIQASTLASSMMETAYFIYYISIKPDKVDEWINHDEYKWSDNFDNWLKAMLADQEKKGEITQEVREEWYRSERYTYSILCASKHNNGFALRKTNVVMEEEGRPHLVSEPRYTPFSRAECAWAISTAVRIAAQALRVYLRAYTPRKLNNIEVVSLDLKLQGIIEEVFELYFSIQQDSNSDIDSYGKRIETPRTEILFSKSFK